jgi:hypothetical protein
VSSIWVLEGAETPIWAKETLEENACGQDSSPPRDLNLEGREFRSIPHGRLPAPGWNNDGSGPSSRSAEVAGALPRPLLSAGDFCSLSICNRFWRNVSLVSIQRKICCKRAAGCGVASIQNTMLGVPTLSSLEPEQHPSDYAPSPSWRSAVEARNASSKRRLFNSCGSGSHSTLGDGLAGVSRLL